MPAFSAINLEPEENIDEEVDTTREIHVDDALKLFQTALRLHSQGPQFFDDATDAYRALFESDIFTYPEAKTEYERTEKQPEQPEPLFAAALDGTDTESSLPQALYLSYKNHGQFLLDGIKHKGRRTAAERAHVFANEDVLDDALRALNDFSSALDRDPSDAELWRRSARVGAFLKSARLKRYCLEAAIELDDDPTVVEVEPPSLAEGFAGTQLKEQLEVCSDEMALTHPIMKPYVERELPILLHKLMDPLPFLPDPTKDVALPRPVTDEASPARIVLDVASSSWAELGMSTVRFLADEGYTSKGIIVNIPQAADDEDEVQKEIDKQLQQLDAVAHANETKQGSVDGEAAEAQTEKPAEKEAKAVDGAKAAEQPRLERSISLPSRKRSQSVAGLPENAEDEGADTKRSKRIRRRDTAVEETMDPATLLATQLQPYQAADQNLFKATKNILENLGVTDPSAFDQVAQLLDTFASDDRANRPSSMPAADLRSAITSFDDATSRILMNRKETPQLGLSAFLEHTKSNSQSMLKIPPFDESRGLKAFVSNINANWLTIHDIAYEWIKAVIGTYASHRWSDQMKTAVVQVISRLDEGIYERTVSELEASREGNGGKGSLDDIHFLIQTLFEVHLDVYERITNPNSVVDYGIRLATKGRLARWLDLATQASRERLIDSRDSLSLRFLWAAVFSATLAEGVSRDHILTCWNSLRDFLADDDSSRDIQLPNNAVIPEISSAAADREISKLTTMDFFLGLFQEDASDPVSVVDTLEPVLNPETVYVAAAATAAASAPAAEPSSKADDSETDSQDVVKNPIQDNASQGLRDLWKFLQNSSTELRLSLWERLGDAYGKIEYTTKQFSCFLKSIEMLVGDFERDIYLKTPTETRKPLFMTMLKSADELLIQALSLALNDNSAFDIIDEDHIKSTSSALVRLSCILHGAAMFEDEVRVGLSPMPSGGAAFTAFLNKLREMQVRCWSLLYTVMKVGININPDVFKTPDNDLAEYLSAVHQVLGLRKCCKASNKIFLKMMRVELLKQKNIENWEDYLGQVLYDLHGLKLGVGIWEVQDHACPPEKLERRNAVALVEKITILAHRMSMKDLLKSDLKNTIEHMQQAIGSTKSTPQMIHNLRNFTEFLKKPIHPLRLFQAFSGSVSLDAVAVNTSEVALAKHGWYFLLGMIALTKFKGVDLNRRQTPGATDDLRMSATYLRLQLQFTPEMWEAWFRLAECFDYELDESVLWSADKMNKDRAELVKFQRNSIHCYTLALSNTHDLAADSDSDTSQEEEALCELYHNFGMRMYASSREPFAMEPFKHSDQERYYISSTGAGTFQRIIHKEMSDFAVWKYAAALFKRAMSGQPREWKNPYMLAKCIWKMYQKPGEELSERENASRPSVAAVISALEKTIEVVSLLPKPRHGQDPILEPHYKILSVVHKLVMRGDLSAQEGANILQRQPYAPEPGEVTISDPDDWDAYVIKSLRHLRDKDKSNWQHRLIIRHARILFDVSESKDEEAAGFPNSSAGSSGNYISAKAAFTVLKESMFTKTMVMNVWKCDAERPGRHHVYTEQYIRLMVRLLVVMNDRVNLEAVLRRIRKKGADFYHFNELWQACVVAYVRLIRQSYHIPLHEEDVFKSFSTEEFETISDKIGEWATLADAQGHPGLGALKEAIELKKLNANLMKAAPIDDLISDCYSLIYIDVQPQLPTPKSIENDEERTKPREEDVGLDGASDANALLNDQPRPEKEREPLALGSLRASSEVPERLMEKQASSTGEPPSKHPRRAGVRRPDILRKAEQAVLRAAEGPPKSAEANGSRAKSRMGSMSSGKTPRGEVPETDGNNSGAEEEEDEEDAAASGDEEDEKMNDAPDGDADEEDVTAVEAADSEASSPAGSVHDSADDESELSDVPDNYEDDIPPSLLFPNLRRSVEAGTGAGHDSDADEDSEENEEEDHEEAEEGEGEHEEEEEVEEEEDEDEEEEEDGEGGHEEDGVEGEVANEDEEEAEDHGSHAEEEDEEEEEEEEAEDAEMENAEDGE